jgi:gentisate 1,2-dioxygenase
MAWIDGLDIPFVRGTDTGFFEFGSEELTSKETPRVSRSERLWGHPGLRPLVGQGRHVSSPIAAYRWEHTDRALAEQLALEDEGHAATTEPGHAAVRFTNPTSGGDVMPTMRAEFHRLRAGTVTAARREVGSAVWQVFDGAGSVILNGAEHRVGRGDMFVVPSWTALRLAADAGTGTGLDLFRFSDTPIFESLHQDRVSIERAPGAEEDAQ